MWVDTAVLKTDKLCFSETWHLPAKPYSVTIQNTNTISAAVRTSHLKQMEMYSSTFSYYPLAGKSISTLRPPSVPAVVFYHHLMDVQIRFNITPYTVLLILQATFHQQSIFAIKIRYLKILRLFKLALVRKRSLVKVSIPFISITTLLKT